MVARRSDDQGVGTSGETPAPTGARSRSGSSSTLPAEEYARARGRRPRARGGLRRRTGWPGPRAGPPRLRSSVGAAQQAGRDVAPVVEPLHGALDRLDLLGDHALLLVDDPGHGLGADPGKGSHVTQCGARPWSTPGAGHRSPFRASEQHGHFRQRCQGVDDKVAANLVRSITSGTMTTLSNGVPPSQGSDHVPLRALPPRHSRPHRHSP